MVPSSQALSPLKTSLVVVPGQHSEWTKAVNSSKRIDRVEIRGTVKRDGHTYYQLQVFFTKSCSNIPTAQQSGMMNVTGDVPDVTTERRLSQFVNFRHEVYYHAQAGHGDRLCAFCRSITRLSDEDSSRPRLHMKLFQGEASVCQSLESFVQSTVEMANSLATPSGRQCDGQREIPLLLHQFLFEAFEFMQDDVEKDEQQSRLQRKSHKTTRSSPWAF